MSTRADQALVDQGLVVSRSLAKRLIQAGAVTCSTHSEAERKISKVSELIESGSVLAVAASLETQFVSRAGAKLEAALAHCGLDIAGRTCLDLGQSTGGFTDCLLKRGAAHVVGIDVGHGQLVATLVNNSRVTVLEGINVRYFDPFIHSASAPYCQQFSVVVLDLSFISLELVLPTVTNWFAACERPIDLVSLVKPQFEVGKGKVSKQGLVTDSALLSGVESKIKQLVLHCGWQCRDYFASHLLGGDGNKEFFVHASNRHRAGF